MRLTSQDDHRASQPRQAPRILAFAGLLSAILFGLPKCHAVIGLDDYHDGICNPGSKRSCYSGPKGTEGVGLCRAGSQTCDADGLAWSACEGEVQPREEDCSQPGDEDCNGTTCSDALWSQRFGDGAGEQVGKAIAWDSNGNAIVAAYVNGIVDFGGGPLDATGGRAVMAKLGPMGKHVWSTVLGDGSARGVAVDESGNNVVVGAMSGMHVRKLDPSGKPLWAKSFIPPSGSVADYASPTAVAVDAKGSIIVVGNFGGTADFGGGARTADDNGNVFIVKLTADGTHIWDAQYGDAAGQAALGVATSAEGDIVVVGAMTGTVDFGGGPKQSVGGNDVFVVKLDPSGGYLWSKIVGDADEQFAQSVAVDHDGNILVAGTFAGTLEFGDTGGRTSAGGTDGYVEKLDRDGNHLWMKSFGDAADQEAHAVTVDVSGNVVVTGAFAGTVDLGAGPIGSMGGGGMFLAKYDPTGKHLWGKGFLDAMGNALAASSTGRVAATGSIVGTTDFGVGPLTPVGGFNVFVATFDP